MLKKSPLAPASFPSIPEIPGVTITGQHVGLKADPKVKDMMMACLAAGTTIAGVFTTSKCPSAPVDWCRKVLPGGKVRAIVVNSGNANAFTGIAGDRVVDATVEAAAKLAGCKKEEIFVASTGVIGQPVPPDHISKRLPKLFKALKPNSWQLAARGIMTTDTFPKGSVRKVKIGNAEVTIAGFAKGSGMIAPDMATMLGFLFTDAKIPAKVLQSILKSATDKSFNSITVDSDTSTSDTVLFCATGKGAKHPDVTSAADANLKDFRRALEEVMTDLAIQIVRDGEGAQKLVTIDVAGAVSAASARRIAGEDANWGRIVMAVGKAGEPADRDKLSVSMGGVAITKQGQVVEGYDETPVAAHIKGKEVHIGVDIGLGRGKARVWTCDLTHGYIEINADYRS
jgi:glutamate N-acetyltransferase/amino-acid N-acetyltransferase